VTQPDPRAVIPERVARRVLAAITAMLLVVTAIPVVAGYVPRAPVIGPFMRLLLDLLPLIALVLVVAVALTWVVWRLGGRRSVRGLTVGLAVLGIAVGNVVAQLSLLAAQHGATWSIVRQRGAEPTGGPDPYRATYTTDGGPLQIDIWTPFQASGTAVLFLHGGGFYGGALGERPALFRALTGAGYTVFDAEYHLSPPPGWDHAPGDALCALAWIEHNSRGNAARVVVIGESAGATLALQAAYAAGTDRITPACDIGPIARPAAVIAISPVVDFRGIWADGTIDLGGQRFPEAYIGGPPSAFPDRYDAASPLALVGAGVPPTLIVLAANDSLVHLERSTPIVDALRAAGASVDVVTVPFADHAFDRPPTGYGEQLEEPLFLDFIARHAGGSQ